MPHIPQKRAHLPSPKNEGGLDRSLLNDVLALCCEGANPLTLTVWRGVRHKYVEENTKRSKVSKFMEARRVGRKQARICGRKHKALKARFDRRAGKNIHQAASGCHEALQSRSRQRSNLENEIGASFSAQALWFGGWGGGEWLAAHLRSNRPESS